MKHYLKYFALLIVLFFISCKKDVGHVNYGDYPVEIGKIISANCAVSGCHNTKSYKAAGNYNLESWQNMFSGSNTGSPVIPYNKKFSSLCYYVNTFPELGLQSQPTMPLNKKALTYEEVKKINDWIDNGAPDINGNVKWAENNYRKKFYAVNQGCDVVTVFDAETQLPMRYIEVGNKPGIIESPHQVKVSWDGKYWYVIFINNNIMQKFRCSDDSYVGEIPLSPLSAGTGNTDALDWNTFIISKDNKRAYCVSWTASGKIAAVDLEKMQLIHFLGGQYFPHGIALNYSEDAVYVASQTGNFITKIDTGFSNTTPFSLDNGPLKYVSSLDPHDILLSKNNSDELLITCQKSNDVRVFNVSSGVVTTTISMGKYPQEIVFSVVANAYFVSCPYDSTSFAGSMGLVTKINASNYATNNLKVGFQPHGIAVDDVKNLIYVVSRNIQSNGPAPHHTSLCNGRNGFVNFIDLMSFTLLPKRYELSVDPYFIYPRP